MTAYHIPGITGMLRYTGRPKHGRQHCRPVPGFVITFLPNAAANKDAVNAQRTSRVCIKNSSMYAHQLESTEYKYIPESIPNYDVNLPLLDVAIIPYVLCQVPDGTDILPRLGLLLLQLLLHWALARNDGILPSTMYHQP